MENLLPRLSLRHLRLINAIATTGQISLAAKQLAMSQPAASRSLSDIEGIIGDPLFDRQPGGVLPTAVGAVAIRHATSLLGQFERLVAEVHGYRHGRSGSVRVGAVTGSAVRYVVPAIQKLKAEAPDTSISVDVAPSVELMSGLAAGDFDIILSRLPSGSPATDLDIHRGREEVLRLVTRAEHPLQSARTVAFAQLQHLTWVVQRAGMPIRDAVGQAFTDRNLAPPADTVDTASLLVALSYLETTDAVAAMTEEVADLVAPPTGPWRVLQMQEEVVMSPYSLLMRNNVEVSPLCARLQTLLKAELMDTD